MSGVVQENWTKERLQAELDAYAAVGLFGDRETPEASTRLGDDITTAVYDGDGVVIWPS